ncbi:endonuclease VII domain-containing protein [Allokutzneria sp. A3M-2-11 16]|uniref:endonuclease domain-containing protein n=1 Tax=Allokutzneria sp. A3M-2-11 16 TaxID=2962043 RepID=UPI0020B79D60|nr:endonuclease domain-containing protein [Allokutzneria sp. A3M-2-11 16]MCP3800215.1 endonuclease VII domain-containing protein [Allokutzneria sp. A3M-2-11 16]
MADLDELKNCRKCGTTRPVTAFPRDRTRPDGRHPYCSPCRAGYHQANRAAALARMAARTQRERDADRDRRYRTRYGINIAVVDDLRAAQHYRCAICGRHEDALPRGLCVDHDHITGTVRALLCQSCNSALGLFNDCPDSLSAAVHYLAMTEELAAIAHAENAVEEK